MTSPTGKQLLLDASAVLATEPGRRLLRDVTHRICAVARASHAGELTHTTAFLEGRRSVGIELDEFLRHADAHLYERMVLESLREAAAPERQKEADDE